MTAPSGQVVIGIDPGKSGAVAIWDDRACPPDKLLVWKWSIHDCPVVTAKVGGKEKEVQDAGLMAAILRPYAGANVQVFLEKVGAMPGQGVTSMFSFGCNFGIWQGIIAAFGFPMTFVTPQAWKKVLMEGMAKDSKDSGRQRALQLFPALGPQLARKKDDGRADALLIAEYGRRTLT